MSKGVCIIVTLACGCFLTVIATALPQAAQKPLTNDDVVKMVKGGTPEGTVKALRWQGTSVTG